MDHGPWPREPGRFGGSPPHTSIQRFYTLAVSRLKVQIRPPGLKPTTKVGTLGPYRGRLGLAWVIAPLLAGALIIVASYIALFR